MSWLIHQDRRCGLDFAEVHSCVACFLQAYSRSPNLRNSRATRQLSLGPQRRCLLLLAATRSTAQRSRARSFRATIQIRAMSPSHCRLQASPRVRSISRRPTVFGRLSGRWIVTGVPPVCGSTSTNSNIPYRCTVVGLTPSGFFWLCPSFPRRTIPISCFWTLDKNSTLGAPWSTFACTGTSRATPIRWHSLPNSALSIITSTSTRQYPWQFHHMDHPNEDLLTDLPVRIEFSNFQLVGSRLVPYQIIRFINGTPQYQVTVSNANLN